MHESYRIRLNQPENWFCPRYKNSSAGSSKSRAKDPACREANEDAERKPLANPIATFSAKIVVVEPDRKPTQLALPEAGRVWTRLLLPAKTLCANKSKKKEKRNENTPEKSRKLFVFRSHQIYLRKLDSWEIDPESSPENSLSSIPKIWRVLKVQIDSGMVPRHCPQLEDSYTLQARNVVLTSLATKRLLPSRSSSIRAW
jgi:hypothetical protein